MLDVQGSAVATVMARSVAQDVVQGVGAPVADVSAQWADVQRHLQASMDAKSFGSWIAPLSVQSVSGGVLTLVAATRFMRDWVRTHYADSIRRAAQPVFGALVRVDVVIGAGAPVRPVAVEGNVIRAFPAPAADGVEDELLASPLEGRFTFDTYVTGDSNRMAVMAARQLAMGGEVAFNPLYIYGGVGMGKTHLLQATAAFMRQARPEARVVYMSAENFMFRFVRALRSKDTMAFKHFFRSVDVLLVDDIQFIGGKESTQEEFFHALNALMEAGKQVVVSADRAVTALEGMTPRLLSRLGGGLVAEISAPDAGMRMEMLQKKCAMTGHDVPEDVLAFLVAQAPASARALEGALNRLIAHGAMMNQPVTLEHARVLLRDVLGCAVDGRVSIAEIQKAVADYYRISLVELLSARRLRPLARPRQVAMYLSKVLTVHSLPDIGRAFAGRDHTTIIHGIRKVESLIAQDARLAADIDLLKAQLQAA